MLLASVNFFLAGTAGFQIARLIKYRKEQGDTTGQVFNYILNGPQKEKIQEPNVNAETVIQS